MAETVWDRIRINNARAMRTRRGPSPNQPGRTLDYLPPFRVPLSEMLTRARKTAAAGRRGLTTLPAFVGPRHTSGIVVVRRRQKPLIDLGSAIAVTQASGISAPRLWFCSVKEQVDRFTHTCSLCRHTRGYPWAGWAEAFASLDSRAIHDKRQCALVFNPGGRSGGAPSRSGPNHTTPNAAGRRGLRSRLFTVAPTSRWPLNRQGTCPTRTASVRSATRGDPCPTSYPACANVRRRNRVAPPAQAAAIAHIESTLDVAELAAVIIEPIQGERALHRASTGILPARCPLVPRKTAWCSSPTEVQTRLRP